MRLTKTDMARVIAQALFNLPELPAPSHHFVLKLVKREKVDALQRQHKMAMAILLDPDLYGGPFGSEARS